MFRVLPIALAHDCIGAARAFRQGFTLELALAASGCNQAHVRQKPRLLSDNGSS
jgi:hypothetical protein